MPIHVKHFDRDKALEVIVFIATNLQKATFHSISKMLYLSDKLHLQEYGRLICGDQYVAMEYGPVPSAIYSMMKVADSRGSIDIDWDEIIHEAISVSYGRNVTTKRNCNMDLISESEVECMQKIIAEHGQKTFGQLTDITHDSAWNASSINEIISVDAIIKTLPGAVELSDYHYSH